MTRICRYAIVLIFLACLSSTNAFALTGTPPVTRTSNNGYIGGNMAIMRHLGIYDSRFDSIVFTHGRDIEVYVFGDTRISATPYTNWRHVTMGNSALPQNITATFWGGNLAVALKGFTHTIELSTLTLTKVDLISPNVVLLFAGSNNAITLDNSSIRFSGKAGHLSAIATAPLTINALSGQNEFFKMSGVIGAQSTQINVAPGSSLKFILSGDPASVHISDRLYFAEDVIGLVDNATLEFNSSNVYFNSSQFQFRNNSNLNITGHFDSRAQFRNLSIVNSQMNQENNTRLQVDKTLTLQGATVTLDYGASIDADLLSVAGDSTINGMPYDSVNTGFNSVVNSPILNITPNQTLTQNGAHLTADQVWLEANATFSVTNNGRASFGLLNCFDDNVIDVGNNSTLAIGTFGTSAGGFANPRIGRDVTFNIDSSSVLRIERNSRLDATDNPTTQTVFNNDGHIDVRGLFGGNGTINGVGTVWMHIGGVLTPGFVDSPQIPMSSRIHTMTFENRLHFMSGTVYEVDLGLSAGAAVNDKIEYIDRNIEIANIAGIGVNVLGTPSATDLDGKSFTVISSRDAASTGTIVRGASDPTLIERATVPALIDFTTVDDNTNGHTDVTLIAESQAYSAILKHPSVARTHRAGTTTTSTPAPGNPTHTITTTVQHIPHSNGTASRVTTTTRTDHNNNVISSSVSTTKLGKAHGSRNKTAAGALLTHAANNGNTTIQSHLNNLQNGQVHTHLNSIHAEPYASYMTVSLEQIDLVLNSVLSHRSSNGRIPPRRSCGGKGKDSRKTFWIDTLYVDGDVDGENNLGAFDYELVAVTIGQDLFRSEDDALGTYFSYGSQNMDEHDIATQALSGNVYHFGMYYDLNDVTIWDIRSVLGYSYGDHESKRYIALGNHSSEVDADYDSHAIYCGIKGGFTWIDKGWVTLAPELGFGYAYYTQPSFEESGNPDLGLIIDTASAQSIITSAGLNARFASLFDSFCLHPLAFVRYEHDWYANSNDEHGIDAALISHPDHKQRFAGRNRGEHVTMFGLGVGSNVSSALQVDGGCVYSQTSHGSELGMGVNLEYRW